MASENKIILNGVEVRTKTTDFGEFLCITDLAKVVGDKTGKIILNWFRVISTIEFLKEWELRYNPDFNVLEYEYIRKEAGTVRFSLSSSKWIKKTNAKGILSEAGKYGGTYAHNAIALEFCSAVSPAFKLGVYSDYLELKEKAAQSLISTYKFYLEKIEDNTLEANQLARMLTEEFNKDKKKLG